MTQLYVCTIIPPWLADNLTADYICQWIQNVNDCTTGVQTEILVAIHERYEEILDHLKSINNVQVMAIDNSLPYLKEDATTVDEATSKEYVQTRFIARWMMRVKMLSKVRGAHAAEEDPLMWFLDIDAVPHPDDFAIAKFSALRTDHTIVAVIPMTNTNGNREVFARSGQNENVIGVDLIALDEIDEGKEPVAKIMGVSSFSNIVARVNVVGMNAFKVDAAERTLVVLSDDALKVDAVQKVTLQAGEHWGWFQTAERNNVTVVAVRHAKSVWSQIH